MNKLITLLVTLFTLVSTKDIPRAPTTTKDQDASSELAPRSSSSSSTRNTTAILIASIDMALDMTFENLAQFGVNATMMGVYLESARLEREDEIVDRALVVIGIMTGCVVVLGVGYYTVTEYCLKQGGGSSQRSTGSSNRSTRGGSQ